MDATKLKGERDEARREVRTIASDNREKITDLKQLFSKASQLKASRDRENHLASEFRQKRDAKKNELSPLREKLSEFKKKLSASGSGNPAAIQEQIERLEWFQQTESLNAKEEKEMSKKIKDLRKQLPQAKEFHQLLADLSQTRKELGKLAEEEKALHEKMVEHSRKGNELHAELLQTSKKIDGVQKSISAAMELLKQKEGVAGEKHGELVKAVGEKKMREMEDRQRHQADEARRLHSDQQKIRSKAQKIYDRFKAGEKISTDELLVLRESGLL